MEEILIALLVMVGLVVVVGPILAIIAIVKASSLRRQIDALRRQVQHLTAARQQPPGEPAAMPAEGPPRPAPQPSPAQAPPPPASRPATFVAAEPSSAQPPSGVPPVATMPRPSGASQGAPSGGIELLVGKKVLAWVGIAIFLIAAGLLIKLAIERQFLPPVAKVLIIVVAGLVLLVAGEWTSRKQWLPLARTLSGGGIATLLLACFAAMAMWELIEWPACMGFMAVVVAVGILLAVRYDSLTIAIISTLAGTAVPLMVWSDDLNFMWVFIFLATLDVGVMVLAWLRRWRVINFIALLGAVIIILAWLGDQHQFRLLHTVGNVTAGVAPSAAIAVVGGFWLLFLAVSLAYHLGKARAERPLDLPLFLINPLWAYATVYSLFDDQHHLWMAPLAVGAGALYLGLSLAVRARQPEARRIVLVAVAIALAFLTLAIPIQLDGMTVPIAFAAEAFLLYLVAGRTGDHRIRIAGFVVYMCMAVSLLYYVEDLAKTYPQTILNTRCLTLAVCILSLALTAVVFRRMPIRHRWTCGPKCAAIPAIAAHVLVLFLFTVETHSFFSHHEQFAGTHLATQLTYSLGYALYATALLVAGFVLRQLYLRISALVLFGITVLKVLTYDLAELEYLYRIFSFLGLAVLLLAGAFLYHRYQHVLLPPKSKEELSDAKP